jgi:hypothetical protein
MSPGTLEQECRTFTQYLIGQTPDAYIIGKYLECHAAGRLAGPADAFDVFLTGIAARGPWRARLADIYASRFRKRSTLRKKLVLTLALLESSPATFEYLDGVDSVIFASLAWRAAVYAAALPIAMTLFFPVHARMALRGRRG